MTIPERGRRIREQGEAHREKEREKVREWEERRKKRRKGKQCEGSNKKMYTLMIQEMGGGKRYEG